MNSWLRKEPSVGFEKNRRLDYWSNFVLRDMPSIPRGDLDWDLVDMASIPIEVLLDMTGIPIENLLDVTGIPAEDLLDLSRIPAEDPLESTGTANRRSKTNLPNNSEKI